MSNTITLQRPDHAPGWKWRQDNAGSIDMAWPIDLRAHIGGLCESGWHTDCPQAPLADPAGNGQCACLCHLTCQWFALCDHRAAGEVAHPVLGSVPTCTRCAERMDLTFIDQES